MSDPMTPERITEIRRRADLVREFGERPTVEASAGDVPALLAEVERLRAELAKRCDLDGCEEFREWLSGEKADADKRARQAKAERDEARTEAGQLRAMYDDLCKSMSQTGDRLATAERERDEAREQLDGIETRVFQRFADGDVEGDDLNAMTVTQLTDYVMAAIRKGRALDGTEAGR